MLGFHRDFANFETLIPKKATKKMFKRSVDDLDHQRDDFQELEEA